MSQRILPPVQSEFSDNSDVWETFAQFYDGRPPNSMIAMAHVPGLVSAFADLARCPYRKLNKADRTARIG